MTIAWTSFRGGSRCYLWVLKECTTILWDPRWRMYSAPATIQRMITSVLPVWTGVLSALTISSSLGKLWLLSAEISLRCPQMFIQLDAYWLQMCAKLQRSQINGPCYVSRRSFSRSVKLRAVTDAPRLTNASELCSFLGFVGYYTKLLPEHVVAVVPLRPATTRVSQVRWRCWENCSSRKMKVVYLGRYWQFGHLTVCSFVNGNFGL